MIKCTDPKWAADQLTTEEAIEFGESNIWKDWSAEQIVRFQLFQKKLALPFSKFHEAIEEVFKRPVFTHEFGASGTLKKEYLGAKDAPTMEEIINLIPADKRIIIGINN